MPTHARVPLLNHRLPADQLVPKVEAAIAACDDALASIAGLPDARRTFANTVEAMENATALFSDTAQRVGILKEIHPEPAVRDAAAQAEEMAGQYGVRVSARRDLYQAVLGYLEHGGRTEKLDAQQQRLLELLRRDFRRNGLELSDEKLAQLVTLRQRMTTLSMEFQKHLNENTDQLVLTANDLEGLPPSYVERLQRAPEGGYIVTTKYPDYVPFMENARNADARRRLYEVFNRREIARNAPILHEVIRLRHEAAQLLGYPTHADFVTEDRMAKTAATVNTFLRSVGDKLRSRRDADYAKLLELKKAETGHNQEILLPWDLSYYLNRLKQRDYDLDTETIREYFPTDWVVRNMFGVYETLLSVKLREVPDADVWAPGVKLFEVVDAGKPDVLAYFYTDLHPRAGKFGHAAVAPTSVPRATPQGYSPPISVLMANFTPPSGDQPSHLTHEEVRTLFHEFGHVMHQSLTTARYGSQAGFNVAGDFVEAPSQMLENWVFAPEVLDRLSAHRGDAAKKLPRELIEKMAAARLYDAGYRYSRQVFLALFDQALHTGGPDVDVLAVERQLYKEILDIEPSKEVFFATSFGHLLGGYDAGYYGYLWSEVFAADMFTLFEKRGVLDRELGRRYRDTILAKGRSIEADALLAEFLGRPASDAAFLQKLGVA
jgi:thimet oligopeptidase